MGNAPLDEVAPLAGQGLRHLESTHGENAERHWRAVETASSEMVEDAHGNDVLAHAKNALRNLVFARRVPGVRVVAAEPADLLTVDERLVEVVDGTELELEVVREV